MLQKPDPTKQLVTDPSNIHTLEQELVQMLGKKRNRFSPMAISTLQWAGLVREEETPDEFLLTPVKTSAIQNFIAAQKWFIAHPPAFGFTDGLD